jgi:hypothetical protein
MSAGFPNRPSRSSFGPTLFNVRSIKRPDKELDAGNVNLAFWQAAGAGRTSPLALIGYNGTTEARVFQALAWDSNGSLAPIPAVKDGTGAYTFTFASTYKDEGGRDVAFQPVAAMAFVQGGASQVQALATIALQDVVVAVKNGSSVATDATFLLMVW